MKKRSLFKKSGIKKFWNRFTGTEQIAEWKKRKDKKKKRRQKSQEEFFYRLFRKGKRIKRFEDTPTEEPSRTPNFRKRL